MTKQTKKDLITAGIILLWLIASGAICIALLNR
jgi:hypothetical protein